MVEIIVKETNESIGDITEVDLQFLVENLVEEFTEDTDYFINQTVLDMLKEKGLNPEVVSLIQGAMNAQGEVEIKYKKAT